MTQVALCPPTAANIATDIKKLAAYLVFDGAVHALEHPDDPAALDDLTDEPKCPRLGRGCIHCLLLRAHGEEVLEEPLCDKEQTQVVLLGNLWALRLDVLEQRREESCVGKKISNYVNFAPHSLPHPRPDRLLSAIKGGDGEGKKKGGAERQDRNGDR